MEIPVKIWGGTSMKVSRIVRIAAVSLFALFGACLVWGPSAQTKSAAPGYHLLKTVSLPQAPGDTEYFDYITVDTDARRVYVTHGTEVLVLNADDYTLVGKIGPFKRSHGAIVVKGVGKGYITDGDAQKVYVFDPKTLKITGEIDVKYDVDSLIYEPATKHIFTMNASSKNTTVIDPAKDTIITNIDLGQGVEFPAVDGKGMVYDNGKDKNEVIAIDARTNKVKAYWPSAPAASIFALGMDPKNGRIFSGGRDPQFMVMMDASNGKVLQSVPITAGVDAIIFEPSTNLIFAATREGMVHIYHEDSPSKITEVETVKTQYGAKTMQIDTKTHNFFTSTSDFDPPLAPTEKQPHPLPRSKPGNFRLLVYGR
jgi:outer membrane protein assembly factor BamB